ncbi:MAG TPA: hypothetical protein VI643_05225, partial [Planctomycetota bacterium]|nr:hypothetical protein [Planctomycetota bacterium]
PVAHASDVAFCHTGLRHNQSNTDPRLNSGDPRLKVIMVVAVSDARLSVDEFGDREGRRRNLREGGGAMG